MKNFNEKCYELLKKVPRGKITTYKELAEALNSKAYRAVGNVMNKNLYKEVPCHRVIKNDGRIGGFVRGSREKIKLLKQEGIEIKKGRVDLNKYLYKFK